MSTNTPVHIDEKLATTLEEAFDKKLPIVVAYADADGQPHISFRGSVQGHSVRQLAIWIREPQGGLLRALPNNPRLTLMYRDPANKITYFIYGHAHVENDAVIAKTIYEKSPKGERDRDPEMGGVAIVIDVDAIEGGTADNRVKMRG
jgi:hypothetical protein